ncbi:MAG TPA: hypothetical protein VHZ95_15900 [Polyangiales bacterium]|nr:hypothetical protein [Polyangiales bacterium]
MERLAQLSLLTLALYIAEELREHLLARLFSLMLSARRLAWSLAARRLERTIDCVAEFAGIGPTIFRTFRESAVDRNRKIRRHVRSSLAQWSRTFRYVLHQHRRCVLRDERRVTGKHVIADDAERVEIAASIELSFADRLFGRHIRRCSNGDAGGGQPCIACSGARDAKIGDHRSATRAINENVVRLDVAMHDAARMSIC